MIVDVYARLRITAPKKVKDEDDFGGARAAFISDEQRRAASQDGRKLGLAMSTVVPIQNGDCVRKGAMPYVAGFKQSRSVIPH